MNTRMGSSTLSNYATTICSIDDCMMVVYHHTVIVKWNPQTITLNTGGWPTSTTKRKMNQTSVQFNLGYHVYQKDFTWFISFKDTEIQFPDNGMVILYR